MPLLIISGLPSSGKSTRAAEIKHFLESRDKRAIIISENEAVPKAGFEKNDYFNDSQKEKIVRSDLKSEVMRFLNSDSAIIFDSGNYIKGYRYELFCASKAARTTQCTLYCAISKDQAWEFNSKRESESSESNQLKTNNSSTPYSRETFDALCLRYEEPQPNNRWDSPLITMLPENRNDYEQLYDALYNRKALPPNQSTQNPPLSATNHLHELDKLTQEIVNTILSARKIGQNGPVRIPKIKHPIDIPSEITAIQLTRLRRQFLNYNKMHSASTNNNLDRAAQLFVQFLNSNYNR